MFFITLSLNHFAWNSGTPFHSPREFWHCSLHPSAPHPLGSQERELTLCIVLYLLLHLLIVPLHWSAWIGTLSSTAGNFSLIPSTPPQPPLQSQRHLRQVSSFSACALTRQASLLWILTVTVCGVSSHPILMSITVCLSQEPPCPCRHPSPAAHHPDCLSLNEIITYILI